MNIVKIPRIVCHIDWSSWPRKPNDFPYDNGSNRDEMRPRAVYPGFGTTGPQSPFGTLHCLYFWVKWSSSFLWGVLYLSHHQYDKIIWYIYILLYIYICMSITGAYVEMFAYLESNWVFFGVSRFWTIELVTNLWGIRRTRAELDFGRVTGTAMATESPKMWFWL